MAASREAVLEEDSSSEDEDQEKFKEAAWSFGSTVTNSTHHNNSAGGNGNDMPSRRVTVSKHDHDGNELQTTPEFRAHVAKKLGALLDNCILETSIPKAPDISTVLSASGKDEDEEGFRLFSTSVPGTNAIQHSQPVPRRPIPSSSDSDSEMEMRLREAAVSVTDLLPPSLLPSMPPSASSPAPLSAEKKKKKTENGNGGESRVEGGRDNGSLGMKKKKKKRKLKEGTSEDGDVATNGQEFLQSKNKIEDQESTEEESFPQTDVTQQPQPEETVVKKRKKKKRKSEKEGEG
ncbi:hypothetical protein AGOR_G00052920 [Albula goreensis]|uniref:Protein CUSTOS n=1 Tax=Albula goreensis TaxID=1534307 RepID=A0A8T3DUZ7_9TELE|nr:hypothetical protein AGOR_G00052920 [Albula goreensis]